MDNTIKCQKYFGSNNNLGHFLTVTLTWPLNKLFSRALSSLSLKKQQKKEIFIAYYFRSSCLYIHLSILTVQLPTTLVASGNLY